MMNHPHFRPDVVNAENAVALRRQITLETVRALSEAVLTDTIVVLLDRNGQVIFMGDKPWQGGSMIRELHEGINFRDVFATDYAEYAEQLFNRALVEGKAEVEIVNREELTGRVVNLSVINSDYVLVAIRNNDEAVAEQQRYLSVLEEVDKFKQQVISMTEDAHSMNHDIANPLAGIIMIVEMMQRKGTIEQTKMESLNNAVNDVLGLIRYFINKIDNQRAFIQKEFQVIEIKEMLREVVQSEISLLKPEVDITAEAQRVEAKIDPAAARVYTLDMCLRHILGNLISNALKYSQGQVQVEIRKEENELILVIRDHGIGVPADQLQFLFNRSFRARNTTGIQGTGRGSMNVRDYISILSGTISVESVENEGTTVTVRLPWHEIEA